MLNHRIILSFGLLVVTFGCGGAQPPAEQPPTPPASSLPPAPIEVAKSPAAPEKPPEPPKVEKAPGPTPVFRITEGIATPESVLYDEANDRYLVSNIDGKPDGVDGNGYITEISPDGKVVKPKFIAGGGKVKLDAPKGTGIAGGILYVADISVVRKFDLKTGAPKGDILIPGATFLNDIAVAKDGRVFVSDSGIKSSATGFDPTGSDAVYVIDHGKVKPVAKGKDLGRPNGLLAVDKGVLVVTFGSNELYRLDEKGAKQDVTKLPGGGLDGIAQAGDSLLVSSWQTSTVYRGTLGGSFEPALTELKGPADIGFDSKRKRLLVPRFLENAVEVYDLK
ncbi:MAG: hypothetical protein ABI548_13450 [Polyangiaceae bacterium]